MTLANVHLDRVAAPWLILRFVDPAAEFSFLEWGLDGRRPGPEVLEHVPAGVTALGMPGAELGLHDADGTCFSKVLRRYGVDDPALWAMERIIAAGVRHAFRQSPAVDETAEEQTLGAALDELGVALGVIYSDAEHIERALGLYDALYAGCRIRGLDPAVIVEAPRLPPLRARYLRSALGIELGD